MNAIAAHKDELRKLLGELTHGTNIDSELRALLRATSNFKRSRGAFQEASRWRPQAETGYSAAADLRRVIRRSTTS